MDENDPIRNEETLFEKFRKRFKKRKREVLITTSNPYRPPAINIDWRAFEKAGISAEEMSNRILKFNKIISPIELREIMETSRYNK